MTQLHRFLPVTLGLALLLPGVSSASDVVLPKLAAKSADPKTVMNVTTLLASELDFNPDVSSVSELDEAPAVTCLTSSSCLKGLAGKGGGDAVLAGSLDIVGDKVKLDMVWFAGGKIVRSQNFTFDNRPESIADGMTGVVQAMLGGKTEVQAEEDIPSADAFTLSDDDDDIDFDVGDFEAAEREAEAKRIADEERKAREAEERKAREAEERKRRAAEEEERRRAEEEERRRAEEERKRREAEEAERRRKEEEARRRQEAEDEARREREAEARRREEDEDRKRREAAAASAAAEEEEEFDPSMISFGSSNIQVADTGDDIKVSSSSSSGSSSRSRDYDDEPTPRRYDDEPIEEFDDLALLEEEEEDEEVDLASLDDDGRSRKEPREKSRSNVRDTRSSGGSTRVAKPPSDDSRPVELHARAGYSPFQTLGFITYGAEIGVPFGNTGVYGLAGVEGYSVQRNIPPAFRVEGGPETEWNTIFPFNAGVVYKIGTGVAQPYVGADLLAAMYYTSPEGKTSWAIGPRFRGGLDLMVASSFGFNLNLAAGYWQGAEWERIQRDMKAGGLIPEFSVGTTFAF